MTHKWRSVARLLGVVILMAYWAGSGWAQTQGGITGTVRDSSGAAIPGADTPREGPREGRVEPEGVGQRDVAGIGDPDVEVEAPRDLVDAHVW